MRSLVLLAALAVPASSAALPPKSAPVPDSKAQPAPSRGVARGPGSNSNCPTDPRLHPVDSTGTVKFRPLGELPPGALSLAVMREVDGCHQPVVVRHGYGSVSGRADEAVSSDRPRPLPRR